MDSNGMLSQDEINALLSGMDVSAGGEASAEPASDEASAAPASAAIDESLLSDIEKDAVGEVANISMGSSATTLYSLVNRKVNITTPFVTLATWESVLGEYEKPCVFIQIKYTKGLDGTNILVLREHDVKVITDLMMGGDGTNTDGELGELHLSAISEAMNQMMGSSSTSLSTMLGSMIDISPPEANQVDLSAYKNGADIAPFLGGTFVRVTFRMQIDELVDSTIMQLYPVDFAKTLVDTFLKNQMGESGGGATATAAPAAPAPAAAPAAPQPTAVPQPAPMPMEQPMQPQMAAQPMYAQPQMMAPPMYAQPQMMAPQQPINIQPAQFQRFGNDPLVAVGQENIGLIKDVPLEVTVELGRTTKLISEILDFTPGTIIELDRIAGEPIDVLVNGKFVAKGEVVVIEESFGIRVTEIIK